MSTMLPDDIPEANIANPDVREGDRLNPDDTTLAPDSQEEPPQVDAR